MINQNLLLAGDDGYNLTKSLRFRSSASAYLSRTLTAPTNNKIWTWSAWVKRGTLSTDQMLLGTTDDNTADGNFAGFRFTSANVFQFFNYAGGYQMLLNTTQVFRDPSAWYHIVLAVDTSQATASNRIKLYVNGVQVTAFTTATYPGQNYDGFINSAITHYQGCYNNASSGPLSFFNGYLTAIYFVDGQQLTPSSFGSTNSSTGVWQPKAYIGTYGNNGYFLPFTNTTSTTTLGNDFSGNNDNWTVNNISLTAGVTYDSMTDVPTLTNATVANYCVLNPTSPLASGTISNANLTFTSGAADAICVGTFGVSSGKWYWEITATTVNASLSYIGIIGQPPASLTVDLSTPSNGYCYLSNGNKGNNNSRVAYGATFTSGDVIGVALDMDAGTLVFYKNNATQGTAYSSLTGTFSPAISDGSGASSGAVFNCNWGQRPFTYTPPTGFVALNTFNLPSSTIVAGNKQMDVTLWTGTGVARNIVNSGSMQPDFVWIKARNQTYDNQVWDSVRGALLKLATNQTAAESSLANSVTGFNSNGIALGDTATVNLNTGTFVGWQWKANGTAVTNTAGSISSQVSANTTSGFSIITWTGTSASAATVGHGLGVAPRFFLVKQRNGSTYNWLAYHASTGAGNYLTFSGAGAATSDAAMWNNTAPSSSVITLSSGANIAITNPSSGTMLIYAWAQIAGYSAFGSYTGNGSTDGPFVFTGFRPKFVMFKVSSTSASWVINDSARNTYNVEDLYLIPNNSNAEGTLATVDFLSNGFKLRTTDTSWNQSSATYIYMAFAENPFKNSLAR
jgi:hypothetical protein